MSANRVDVARHADVFGRFVTRMANRVAVDGLNAVVENDLARPVSLGMFRELVARALDGVRSAEVEDGDPVRLSDL